MPKIFGSRLNGNFHSAIIKNMVINPPEIIDTIAAMVLVFFIQSAATNGTNNPETIKA